MGWEYNSRVVDLLWNDAEPRMATLGNWTRLPESAGLSGLNGYGGYNGVHDHMGLPVRDYKTEVPLEEAEGHQYKLEKRKLREDATLRDSHLLTWGDGKDGKLGHQSEEKLFVPYTVAALARIPVRQCALGKKHTLFLSEEGLVLSCGSGQYGQLGLGGQLENRYVPVLVQGLKDIKQVACGHYHCMALSREGSLYSWGSGSWGKLGLSFDGNINTPRLVATLMASIVESVACGAHHTACVTISTDLWTWGKGTRGQLGHNSVKEEYSPRLVSVMRRKGVEKVACGKDHTLVLVSTGSLWAFGANHSGQLGLGLDDTQDRAYPVEIKYTEEDDGELEGMEVPFFHKEPVADIAANGNLSLALCNSGKVFMWGDGRDRAREAFRMPQEVWTLPRNDPIVGLAATHDRAYVLSDSGRIFRWTAKDINLEVGAGELEPFHAIAGVVRMFCGYDHMAVLCTTDLGLTQPMITREKANAFSEDICSINEAKVPDEVVQPPVKVMPEVLDDFDGSGVAESPSREGDGTVYTYGKGSDGRLGHGLSYTLSEASKLQPARVETLAKMSVIHVNCGKDATAAITDVGRLYTWGNSAFGKLGLGFAHGSVVVPQLVEALKNKVVVRVSMGRNHTLCLTDEGKFFSWGSNTFGQLGLQGVTTHISSPDEVSSLREKKVKDFAAGGFHSVVCTWTYEIYTCGKGWHGQLGQGDYESLTAQSKTLAYFKKVAGGLGYGHNVSRVFAGTETSAAISETGQVFTWGQGSQYQLGHNSTGNESQPRLVEKLKKVNIVDMALGKSHCVALDDHGTPYSWGKGNAGQLGMDKSDKEKLPRAVVMCKRYVSKMGVSERVEKIMPWGSFYTRRERDQSGEEVEYTDTPTEDESLKGKVVQVASEGNYTMFLMQRKANPAEIKEYLSNKSGMAKKMTEFTIIRELFCCGAGKGGVMQNQGKENEMLPKLMPYTEQGELLQDCIQVSGGRGHVAILQREDNLRNVEAKIKENQVLQDQKFHEEAGYTTQAAMISEMKEQQAEQDEMENQALTGNPYDAERRLKLERWVTDVEKAIPNAEETARRLTDLDVDLETLSTMRTDDDLRALDIRALGARRRLLKHCRELKVKHPPPFYAWHNEHSFFVCWPPLDKQVERDLDKSLKTQEEVQRKAEEEKEQKNPGFDKLLKANAGKKMFNALVRYAEQQHLEEIEDRAILRYQARPDGNHRVWTWGVGLNGRLGHGYGMSYATPHLLASYASKLNIVRIALGSEHTVACTYDGSVFTWGNGDVGQLGATENFDGVGVNMSYVPRAVSTLKRYFVIYVAAGRWHSIALTNDRTVWSWGDNKFGQLGQDSNETMGVPQQIKFLDGRATCMLVCGGWHSAVITESGKFFVWGLNSYGQLGDGTRRTVNHPVLNSALRGVGRVRSAAFGAHHSLVVTVDNQVYSFGRGDKGQLGHAQIQTKGKDEAYLEPHPKSIQDLMNRNVIQVAAGDEHSMALSVFGELWTWGGSPFGQLGHGGIMDIRKPTLLSGQHSMPMNLKAICAGYTFSMALTDGGELYSWGQGESGELGHAQKILMYSPLEVPDLKNVVFMAAGHRHAAAITFKSSNERTAADGAAEAEDEEGQGATADDKSVISEVRSSKGGSTRGGRSVGGASSRRPAESAVTGRSGKKEMSTYVMVWGEDTCGQLGMRGLQGARSPSLVQSLERSGCKAVAASADCSAFVTKDGKLFMCGSGEKGRLGLGHGNSTHTPLQVQLPLDTQVKTVSCGFAHTVCLTEEQRVFCWGDAQWGNTGSFSLADVLEPSEIASLGNKEIHSVVAGGYHSFAISEEGHLWAWGKNSNGQLGLGSVSAAEPTPQKVEAVGATVQHVAAGANHSAIVCHLTPPNLFMCGMNANGQLGLDDQVDRCDPTPIQLLDDRTIISVGCGLAHTAAVSQYGDVLTWGNGRSGQLGIFEGVDSDRTAPVQLPGFSEHPIQRVACGAEITCAVTDMGELYMWGSESGMGLGGNQARDPSNPSAPKEVEGLDGVVITPHGVGVALGAVHAVALVASSVSHDYEDGAARARGDMSTHGTHVTQ